MSAPTCRQRFAEAATDHEAMVAAFAWLQAALIQNVGWNCTSDPLGSQHQIRKNQTRRDITQAIIATIEGFGDGSE